MRWSLNRRRFSSWSERGTLTGIEGSSGQAARCRLGYCSCRFSAGRSCAMGGYGGLWCLAGACQRLSRSQEHRVFHIANLKEFHDVSVRIASICCTHARLEIEGRAMETHPRGSQPCVF